MHRVIVLDVIETLLDLRAPSPRFGRTFGDEDALAALDTTAERTA